MTDWLFPDFREDQAAYGKAQSYWTNLWNALLESIPHAGPWESPWMKNPDLDGNPIFTAVSRSQRRGVRIIQQPPPGPGEIDLDFWIDTFGQKSDPDAITELVISCCPSRSNMFRIEQMIREWVESGRSPVYPQVAQTEQQGSIQTPP